MKTVLLIILLALFTILFSGCGLTSLKDDHILSIAPELRPYYDRFIEEGKKRGLDYSDRQLFMYFSDLGNDELLGISVRRIDGIGEVVINKPVWDRFNNGQPGSVVIIEVGTIHELGHALLSRKHNDNCLSIMSTLELTRNTCKFQNYSDNPDKMFDELFYIRD